jgi:hypothetical protein
VGVCPGHASYTAACVHCRTCVHMHMHMHLQVQYMSGWHAHASDSALQADTQHTTHHAHSIAQGEGRVGAGTHTGHTLQGWCTGLGAGQHWQGAIRNLGQESTHHITAQHSTGRHGTGQQGTALVMFDDARWVITWYQTWNCSVKQQHAK